MNTKKVLRQFHLSKFTPACNDKRRKFCVRYSGGKLPQHAMTSEESPASVKRWKVPPGMYTDTRSAAVESSPQRVMTSEESPASVTAVESPPACDDKQRKSCVSYGSGKLPQHVVTSEESPASVSAAGGGSVQQYGKQLTTALTTSIAPAQHQRSKTTTRQSRKLVAPCIVRVRSLSLLRILNEQIKHTSRKELVVPQLNLPSMLL